MATKALRPIRVPTTTRYEFLEPIGTGGMGTVFRGQDRYTGQAVAIKVLKARLSQEPSLHYRFALEFRAASRLEHPNIVRALDFGNDGAISYLVYELIEGASLGAWIAGNGPLPEDEALRVITQVAQALDYAHQRQVIHRDVKPDNILLTTDGRAKLTDFGLAKDHTDNQDLTKPASMLGTPHFMAPEQFADAKTVGVPCDVYSLGATLYNALTGTLPFDAKFGLAILTKKERGELPSLKALVPGLSDRTEAAIRAALAPDPANRPASCLEFFKQLTARPRFDNQSDTDPTVGRPAPEANRRASVRRPLVVGTCGTVDTGLHAGGKEAEEVWPVVVRDVSAGGVGFLLARRFEPGTHLTIDLKAGPNAPPRKLAVRVVRVEPDALGHWAFGCVFARPLTDDEVAAVLRFA